MGDSVLVVVVVVGGKMKGMEDVNNRPKWRRGEQVVRQNEAGVTLVDQVHMGSGNREEAIQNLNSNSEGRGAHHGVRNHVSPV